MRAHLSIQVVEESIPPIGSAAPDRRQIDNKPVGGHHADREELLGIFVIILLILHHREQCPALIGNRLERDKRDAVPD